MLRAFFFIGMLNMGPLYGQTSDSLPEGSTPQKDTLTQGLIRVQQMEERFQDELYANDFIRLLRILWQINPLKLFIIQNFPQTHLRSDWLF